MNEKECVYHRCNRKERKKFQAVSNTACFVLKAVISEKTVKEKVKEK